MADRKKSRDRSDDPAYYAEQLLLDKDDLDTAIVGQADLYYRVSENLSLAISKRDDCKLELERTTAELDQQFRAKLEKEAGEGKRVTDKAVTARVEQAPAVEKLRDELITRQSDVAKWSNLRDALSQRSTMIKVLAELYASNYWAKSSVKGARDRHDTARADEYRDRAGRDSTSKFDKD